MNYEAKTIKRIFKNLPIEEKQSIWLEMSSVMEGYADKNRSKIELIHIGELEDQIVERLKTYGQIIGLGSGYPKLDELTKGFVPGELIIVGGITSGGKTLLATNLAFNQASRGKTVLFVTLEMTHTEIGARFAKISGGDIKKLPILFQKQDELDWKLVDKLIETAKNEGAEMVFIDHLHYFTRELENVNEDLGRITKEIKKNAIRHQLPIVMMSHVRKSQGGQREVDTEDLRGSSYIGQDADIILFVGRKKDSNPPLFIVKCTKNRNRGVDFDKSIEYAFKDLKMVEL